MSAPKSKFMPEPRIVTSQGQVAAVLDKSAGWFHDNRSKLEAQGFPKYDPLLKGWDLKAIHIWLDIRSKIDRPQEKIEEDIEGQAIDMAIAALGQK